MPAPVLLPLPRACPMAPVARASKQASVALGCGGRSRLLRLLDFMGPVASNNLAAVVVKPDLPGEKFAWLESHGKTWKANTAWFAEKFVL